MENKTCNNCKLYLRDDCGGLGPAKNCQDYDGAPTISKAERDLWPTAGDATVFRTNDTKEIRRRKGWDQ